MIINSLRFIEYNNRFNSHFIDSVYAACYLAFKMDFKKLASDAGTLFSRAKQVSCSGSGSGVATVCYSIVFICT